MGTIADLTGKRFGKLVVVKLAGKNNHHKITWLCRCDCGQEKVICAGSLVNQLTLSCGCYRKEYTALKNTTHGLSYHPIYKHWVTMMRRCYDVNFIRYDIYGGRGIVVCNRWHKFINFYNDMVLTYQKGLTIDRKNVDGNYKKSNCRWATATQQGRNKRNNRLLTYNGVTRTLSEWEEIKGTNRVISGRLKYGWSIEDAISKPVI